MPKVAIVYHFFAHYREPVLRELASRGRYSYLFLGDTRDPFREGIAPADLDDLPNFRPTRCRVIGGRLLYQQGLLRLALRRDVSAIIYLGNAKWPMTWLSATLARLTGKRVLFWTHGWTDWDREFAGRVRSVFYRLAHGLLLYGHFAKAVGIGKGFRPEHLHVIYNSLDHEGQRAARLSVTGDDIARTRADLFGDPATPVVICTSRLTATRRLDMLLEALALLQAEGHPVNLLLVGDGPERVPLEALAATKGLNVHFFGPCYEESVLARLIMASNATVAPGKVGLTAMHSLAYGVPVVTHDDPEDQMPEFEAVIPGKSGSLFTRGDVADLARAIRRWTGTPHVSDEVRHACNRAVDRFYTPSFQRRAIERAIAGADADDLFWMREPMDA